jgi:hypothetical protein
VTARFQALVRGGWLQLGLALGVGYAAFSLATSVADVIVGVVSQHATSPFGENSPITLLNLFSGDPFALNFHVGKTLVIYGYVLISLIALGFVLLARAVLSAWTERDLQPCPHCLTLCPFDASVCKACSLAMVEPEAEPA